MTKVHGLMVMKNEAERYLLKCLRWNMKHLDDLFCYDDQSEDNSRKIAWRMGASVEWRPRDVPSFLEHEGKFRQAAWDAFEVTMNPHHGDVVIVIDADEFLIHDQEQDRIKNDLLASEGGSLAVLEVFAVANGVPQIRIDGFWGAITSSRVCRYESGGRFPDRAMASGNLPVGLSRTVAIENIRLLHYGYARSEDRESKHARYAGLSGHNPAHIASIVQSPKLMPWMGVSPCLT